MKTNTILLKFQSNNNKLESVLSKKKFSGDVKNLLLSMLYKITSSYNDYTNIKVNVENRNKYAENIIKIIERCDSINIVKPNEEQGQEFLEKGITSKVNPFLNTIDVFPTEKAMLFALFKMNDTKMYIDEKYNLIRIALPELLNEGRDINNIEIIRDFNAWSWNTLPQEISNIDCNLIYQNLQILLGFEFLDNWMKKEHQKELLNELKEELKSKYNNDNVKKLLQLIYRVAIIVCIQRNENEKQRLLDEKAWDEKELERLSNKQELVIELTQIKKDRAREIERLDKIINDEQLLIKEFEERNSKLSEYKKIFSVNNLLGTLKKERKKALADIEESNGLLDAKKYVEVKKELEESVELLRDTMTPINKEKYKIEIQKIFIECLKERVNNIEKVEQRQEIIDLFWIVRYYNFIVYDEERFIKDIEPLCEQIEELEEKIIKKLYEFKLINNITKDLETDIKIIQPILSSRIMNLENISIQLFDKERTIEVNIYDGNIPEFGFNIENFNNISIKGKKKTRLFIK